MSYLSSYQNLPSLIKYSFKSYGKALGQALFFIVLAVVVQDYYLFISDKITLALYPRVIAIVVVSLVSLFFWSAAIYSSHCAIEGESKKWGTRLLAVLGQFHRIVFIAILYVAIFVVSLYWLRLLNYIGTFSKIISDAQGLVNLIFVGIPLLLSYLLLIFSVPLILSRGQAIGSAIKNSCKTVWASRFKTSFALYFVIMILFYATVPVTHHANWLSTHHIKLLFDLVIFIIFSPLVMSFSLYAANNPEEIRSTNKQKK